VWSCPLRKLCGNRDPASEKALAPVSAVPARPMARRVSANPQLVAIERHHELHTSAPAATLWRALLLIVVAVEMRTAQTGEPNSLRVSNVREILAERIAAGAAACRWLRPHGIARASLRAWIIRSCLTPPAAPRGF